MHSRKTWTVLKNHFARFKTFAARPARLVSPSYTRPSFGEKQRIFFIVAVMSITILLHLQNMLLISRKVSLYIYTPFPIKPLPLLRTLNCTRPHTPQRRSPSWRIAAKCHIPIRAITPIATPRLRQHHKIAQRRAGGGVPEPRGAAHVAPFAVCAFLAAVLGVVGPGRGLDVVGAAERDVASIVTEVEARDGVASTAGAGLGGDCCGCGGCYGGSGVDFLSGGCGCG